LAQAAPTTVIEATGRAW